MKIPETPEMKNKLNMTTAHQLINPLHMNQTNQINQWFRQTNPTGKCIRTGKVNSIDNQRVINQNPKNNRQQTGKTVNSK
jgi:hypothetical protein